MSKHFALGGHKFQRADLLSLSTADAIDGHRSPRGCAGARRRAGKGNRSRQPKQEIGGFSRRICGSSCLERTAPAGEREIKRDEKSPPMTSHPRSCLVSFGGDKCTRKAAQGHKISRLASRGRREPARSSKHKHRTLEKPRGEIDGSRRRLRE